MLLGGQPFSSTSAWSAGGTAETIGAGENEELSQKSGPGNLFGLGAQKLVPLPTPPPPNDSLKLLVHVRSDGLITSVHLQPEQL